MICNRSSARQRVLAALTVTLLSLVATVAGAASFALRGIVRDAAGKPLANAEIVITELQREAYSGANGAFAFADVPAGDYTVVVYRAGYANVVRDVMLNSDADLTLDLIATPFVQEPVNVTAARSPINPLRSPLPTAALGGDAVRREHSVSLAHVVDQIPGVRTLSTGGEIGKPVIRGLTGSRVLVLDNGNRMEDYSWSDEDGPSIDPSSAERVEVIRGPASVLYGSDALGGVINVIPAELPNAEGAKSFSRAGGGAYFANNNHEFGGNVQAAGARGDWGWRFNGIGRKAEALHTPRAELENTGFFAANGDAAIGVHGDKSNATLRIAHYGGEFHLLEANGPPPGSTPGVEEGPVRKAEDDRVQLTANLSPEGDWRLETKVQYQRHSLIEVSDDASKVAPIPFSGGHDALNATETPAFDLLLNTVSIDVLAHHTAAERLHGTLGVNAVHQTNDSKGPIFYVPDATVQSAAAFAFEQFTMGRWSVLAGVRGDSRKVEGTATGNVLAADTSRIFTRATGNAGVVFQPVPQVSLAANAGRAWRSPTLFELFANGPVLADARYEIGRASLREEVSTNLDASVRWQTATVRGEVSAYRNTVGDFIYLQPTGDVRYTRSDTLAVYRHVQADATLKGVEASLDVHALPHLILGGRFDMVRGMRDDGVDLPLMPAPRGVLYAELQHNRGLGFRRSHIRGESEIVGMQSHLNPFDIATRSYTLFHLELVGEREMFGRDTELSIRVRNIANTEYRDFLSRYKQFALSPGRDVVFRVAVGI